MSARPRSAPRARAPPRRRGAARARWRLCAALQAGGLGLGRAQAAPLQPAPRPHIVVFLVDDLGWHNVGWHNAEMSTPHADALVAQGVELDRHYTYHYCSPSRASLMSGRLPFHVNQINVGTGDNVPKNMTWIPAKLKSAGYATHMVGKWHLGVAYWQQIPQQRGFDTSLHYFGGAEDGERQTQCIDSICIQPDEDPHQLRDLWDTDRPASTLAGTDYGGFLFTRRAVSVIAEHDPLTPLFLYVSMQQCHTPLQVPASYAARYPEHWYRDRRLYAGMVSFWDESLGNITAALRRRNMWDRTLLVVTGDNGGPVYWAAPETKTAFPHGAGGNNWPLKGGKISNLEGGVRVASFVSGGFVPEGMRGRKLAGLVHIADWYATFCGLAGVSAWDSAADASGLPQPDALDMWPWLSGSAGGSPRSEIPLCVDFQTSPLDDRLRRNASALLQADGASLYKLLEGVALFSFWQGPAFPNASGYGQWQENIQVCDPACLYDVAADPTEHRDLARALPVRVADMRRRLGELRQSHFQQAEDSPPKHGDPFGRYGGFLGPWAGLPGGGAAAALWV